MSLPSFEVFLNAAFIATLITIAYRVFGALFEGPMGDDDTQSWDEEGDYRKADSNFSYDKGTSINDQKEKFYEASEGETCQVNFSLPKNVLKEAQDYSPDRDVRKGLEDAYHLWLYLQRQKQKGFEIGLYHRENGNIHLIDFVRNSSHNQIQKNSEKKEAA